METLLKRSVEEKSKLEMIYYKVNGEFSQRIIRVIKNMDDKILAYCFSKKEVRTFSKKNILSILPNQHNNRMGA
ncbi:hypothetical protein ACLIA0_03200 [Bacillaceae bacterium W0354]